MITSAWEKKHLITMRSVLSEVCDLALKVIPYKETSKFYSARRAL
jgi:hypothetical protein